MDHSPEPDHEPDHDGDGLVWHYTDGPGLLSILASHTLWATANTYLNDREEVVLGGRMIAERILELAADHGDAAGDLADLVREAAAHGDGAGDGNAYILSSSRSADSLAMWRLYGGDRESYAVGLEASSPLAVLATGEVRLAGTPGATDGAFLRHQRWQAVRYGADEQRALVDRALGQLGDLVRTWPRDLDKDTLQDGHGRRALPPDLAARLEPFLESLQEALLLIKHAGFVDERETRYSVILACPPGPVGLLTEASLLSHRASAYGLAPYLRLTGVRPDEPTLVAHAPVPLPIRAISVSPSQHGDHSTTSVRQVLLRHGYDVPVLRSRIPFRG